MNTGALPWSMHCFAQTGLLGRISPFATLEAVHFSHANQPVNLVAPAGAGSAPVNSRPIEQSPRAYNASLTCRSLLVESCCGFDERRLQRLADRGGMLSRTRIGVRNRFGGNEGWIACAAANPGCRRLSAGARRAQASAAR